MAENIGTEREPEELQQELARALERVRFCEDVLENSSQPFAAGCPDGRLTYFNRAFTELAGYGEEELKGKTWAVDLTPPEWREKEREVLRELHRTGRPVKYEKEYVRKDGSRVPIEVKAHLARGEEGEPEYYYAFVTDITDRKNAERQLKDANRRLSDYIVQLEERNREIEALSRMASLLQASLTNEEANRIISRSVRRIFASESGAVFLLDEERNLLEPVSVWGGPRTEEVFSTRECWALRLGRAYTVEDARTATLCPHVHKDLETAYICVPMMALNVTIGFLHLEFGPDWRERPEEARRQVLAGKAALAETVAESLALSLANLQLRKELFAQSIHDPLTGLFNRQYMLEVLEKELNRMKRREKPLAVVLMDIDHFREFNEAYGHTTGDMLLRELGSFLQAQVRGEDFASRFGGEKFLIVLPETPVESAAERARQLHGEMKNVYLEQRGRKAGPASLSVGVAGYPIDGRTAHELLDAAERAVARAKSEGGDRVETA